MVAVFVLLLALAPVSAQHGGGHASGGGHGGTASHGGFGGHSGGHAFSGAHSGSGMGAHSFSGSASRGSFSSRGFNHSGGGRLRGFGFRNNCYRYGCGYGYPYLGGGIDPYWWWNSGSSFDYDQQYQTGVANEMNAQSLDEQRMRQQGDQDLYARSAPPPPREHSELNEAAPATVLVFRDEHKQEIHNYAIVGQTLWNFNPQHTQKIPLSDLDIPATTKENEDRGVDFRLPSGHDGQ
jgi:hypothetical protein